MSSEGEFVIGMVVGAMIALIVVAFILGTLVPGRAYEIKTGRVTHHCDSVSIDDSAIVTEECGTEEAPYSIEVGYIGTSVRAK